MANRDAPIERENAPSLSYALERRPLYRLSPDFGYVEPGDFSDKGYDSRLASRVQVNWATTTVVVTPSVFRDLNKLKRLSVKEQSAFIDYLAGTRLTAVGTVKTGSVYQDWKVYTLQVTANRGSGYHDALFDLAVSPDGSQAVAFIPVVGYRDGQFERDEILATRASLDPWGLIPLEHEYEIFYSIAHESEQASPSTWITRRYVTAERYSVDVMKRQDLPTYQRYPGCDPKIPCDEILSSDFSVVTTTDQGEVLYERNYSPAEDKNVYFMLLEDRYLVQVSGGALSLIDGYIREPIPVNALSYVPSGLCVGWGEMAATTTQSFIEKERGNLREATFHGAPVLMFRSRALVDRLRAIPGVNYDYGMGSVSFDRESFIEPVLFAPNLLGQWTLYIERSACGI